MAWSDIADRALQKAIKAFKIAAIYTPEGRLTAPYALDGVFSKPAQSVDPQTGVMISTSHLTFGVRLADMTEEPREGDELTIGNVTYRVLDAQGDGEGGSSLTLHKIGS